MSSVLTLSNTSVERDGKRILSDVNWNVTSDQRWVVLGPNGAGKTTLLELASDWETPNAGSVVVLGENTTHEDAEWIRPRVGIASSGMAKRIPATESVLDAVTSAAYASAERNGENYDEIDIRRAKRVLAEWGLGGHEAQAVGTLSEGEAKRLQLARAIMTDPELLLLDEPTAGLDLGAREELLAMLGAFAGVSNSPAIIMVTHHLEEIPPGFTHALVLTNGTIAEAGPIAETLTSEKISRAYGLTIDVSHENGRFSARARVNV
jgi:iron complex transport system ATP-binding protein